MATLELTDEQVIALIEQLPEEQKRRVVSKLARSRQPLKRRKFGSAKDDIVYMHRISMRRSRTSKTTCEAFLIDTHAFFWFAWGDPQLSRRARHLIEDGTNRIIPSIARKRSPDLTSSPAPPPTPWRRLLPPEPRGLR